MRKTANFLLSYIDVQYAVAWHENICDDEKQHQSNLAFILDLTQENLQLNTDYLLLLPFTMLTVRISSGQTRRFQLGFNSKIYL